MCSLAKSGVSSSCESEFSSVTIWEYLVRRWCWQLGEWRVGLLMLSEDWSRRFVEPDGGRDVSSESLLLELQVSNED